jgi:uncharacterized protein YegL
MLDDSGSMSGQRWKDLKSASTEFLDSLTKQKNPGDRISCIIYNSSCRLAFTNQVPGSHLNCNIVHNSGGTRYAPALSMAKSESRMYHKNFTKIIYYFMSDGHPHDEDEAYK